MSHPTDTFDELAALFLTETPPKKPDTVAMKTPDEVDPQTSVLEVVVVGHLPVRAGLWLTPYVDMRARSIGPAALVRLDQQQPSLEILRSNALPQTTDNDSLRQAIHSIAAGIALWVVRPAERCTASEVVKARPRNVTILSSADEAALVSSYQRIKEIAEAAEDVGYERPSFGIAVLGAKRDDAERMVERLNRTTQTFLDLSVPLVTSLPQIDSEVHSNHFASFATDDCPTVGQTIRWIDSARTTGANGLHPRDARSRPTPAELVNQPVETMSSEAADEVVRANEPFAAETVATPDPSPATVQPELTAAEEASLEEIIRGAANKPRQPEQKTGNPRPERQNPAKPNHEQSNQVRFSQQHTQSTIKLTPKAGLGYEPKPQKAPPREPDDNGRPRNLSEFVAGLMNLPVRCPGHERVELAADANGHLHLLAREPQLRSLRVVAAWAKAHRELIALACPDRTFDLVRPPKEHVFTDRPASLSDLITAEMQLHVLAPVQVGDEVAWYNAPLK